jgi:hypothetical protein
MGVWVWGCWLCECVDGCVGVGVGGWLCVAVGGWGGRACCCLEQAEHILRNQLS